MKIKFTQIPVLLFVIVLSSISITSCKKEKPEPPKKERFPIEYYFINENDKNVKTVFLDMTTFYPYDDVDKQGDSLSFLDWRNMTFNEPPITTIKVTMDRTGYAACTGLFRFNILFRDAVYSPVYAALGRAGDADLPNGWTRGRTYVGDTVTMRSAPDGIITFRWPSDTAKYKEVIYF